MKVEALSDITIAAPGQKEKKHAKGAKFDLPADVARTAADAKQVKILDEK